MRIAVRTDRFSALWTHRRIKIYDVKEKKCIQRSTVNAGIGGGAQSRQLALSFSAADKAVEETLRM